jgi:hypothetical protein
MLIPRVCLAGTIFFTVLAGASGAQAQDWLTGITLVEVRGGVLAHDVARDNEHTNSIDLNLEFAFESTRPIDFGSEALNFVLNPRGIIGGSINTEGDTHQAYVALDWRYQFINGIFVEASFGAVGHTGNLEQDTVACPPSATCSLPGNRAYVDTGEPSFGFPVLFREHAEVGYRMDSGWSISVIGAHMSNAGLSSDNDGMDFVGLRLGYAFGPEPE